MSIPFSIVTCSDCDLRGSTLQLAGLFRWRDRTGRSCHMARTMGFCPDCDALVAMEILPTPGDLEDARTRASEHRAYNAKLASPWGRLRNALATFPRRPVAIDDPEVLDAVHRLRRKPACLRCGSSEVTALPWPKDISTRARASIGSACTIRAAGASSSSMGPEACAWRRRWRSAPMTFTAN